MPAAAFHSGSVSPSDLYSTSDLIASSLANGTLAYSIGCHAGLSVPDVWLSSPDPSSLDWAQAFARMNGVFDGNTGFGYGDTNTIAYSAKLVAQLTRDIGPAMSIGQAVAYAKQQYYSSLGAWGVFDAKSVEEFTPYGLPMYVVGAGGQVAGPVAPSSPPPLSTDPDSGLQSTSLSFGTLNSGSTDTGHGVYYKGPTGLTQAEQYRPIEPVTAPQDMTEPDSTSVRLHGALMLSFTTTDVTPFTAAISTPTLAPGSDQPQPQLSDATFPSSFVGTLSEGTIFGRRDSLVAFGGQFVSKRSGPPNTGTQRLFSNASVRAYYSGSTDDTVAIFSTITGQDMGNVAAFSMTTPALDVASAYVTYRLAGSSNFVSQKMTFGGGAFTANVDTSSHKVAEYFMQMVTAAGNTSVSDDKALMYPSPPPPPPPPGSAIVSITDGNGSPMSPNEFGWFNTAPLSVSVTSSTETFTATLDGNPATLPITGLTDGVHSIVYTGSMGTTGHVDVPIDIVKPGMTPTPPACPGQPSYLLNTGGGSQALSVSATDSGSGINAGASVLSATLKTSTVGSKTITFFAKDFAGNATSDVCTYSVQYKFSGFFQPIDNPPTINVGNAGQTVPVKWQITDANGVAISDPASFISLTTINGSCQQGSGDSIETYSGSSGLQYLGNGNWQFNWKTPKSYSGTCKTMVLNLADGVIPAPGQPRTAYFRFK